MLNLSPIQILIFSVSILTITSALLFVLVSYLYQRLNGICALVDEINLEAWENEPKKNETLILSFVVVNTYYEFESKGEILELSHFGEYCPPQSLRGYQLDYLLARPINYKPLMLKIKGEVVEFNEFN